MADTPTDVLVGAYPDIDAATNDFDALAKLVEGKQVKMEAAILITHTEDGAVTVEQTADHVVARGSSGAAPWVSWSVWPRRRCSRRRPWAQWRAG